MNISDFDFNLPQSSIAQYPVIPKDNAKLLRLGQHGTMQDKIIRNLPQLLREGDLLIVNDTKVIPGKLLAKKGNATIGVTLDQPLPNEQWHVIFKNSKRLKIGDQLHFLNGKTKAYVTYLEQDGSGALKFNIEGKEFDCWLQEEGKLALPPYIIRKNGPLEEDCINYHTIFSHHPGAVAAPTAGLHFTEELLSNLHEKGIERLSVTLHVGAGTFLPIKTLDPSQHHMHSEFGNLSSEVADKINNAKKEGRRIISVGTTTLRLLESAADANGILHPFHQSTSIFITPGFPFKIVDVLMTNFHLPRSTLYMLVCAFAGTEIMKNAYRHAIENHYRFYSYGDACLIDRLQ